MARMTKKGARRVTADLDRIAGLLQEEWRSLGIPRHIAFDYAKRTDMISDAVERTAQINHEAAASNSGWDPEDIGEEKSGPLVMDSDEDFMGQEFSQQENRELRERVQNHELGPDRTTFDPRTPSPGVQASFRGLVRALKGANLDREASARVAKALALATTVTEKSSDLPPELLENAKKKKDEAKDKKAGFSHGYNLSA